MTEEGRGGRFAEERRGELGVLEVGVEAEEGRGISCRGAGREGTEVVCS